MAEELLTPAQVKVLQLAANGRTVKQTAAELGNTPNTIGVHRADIIKKLGADNITHAVAIGIRKGEIQ